MSKSALRRLCWLSFPVRPCDTLACPIQFQWSRFEINDRRAAATYKRLRQSPSRHCRTFPHVQSRRTRLGGKREKHPEKSRCCCRQHVAEEEACPETGSNRSGDACTRECGLQTRGLLPPGPPVKSNRLLEMVAERCSCAALPERATDELQLPPAHTREEKPESIPSTDMCAAVTGTGTVHPTQRAFLPSMRSVGGLKQMPTPFLDALACFCQVGIRIVLVHSGCEL